MASQSLTSNNKKFRHRLRAITLDPATSAYDIGITLLVDDKKVHKLRRAQKGQTLRWDDLPLPCDVHESSTLTVQVDEMHKTRGHIESHQYQVSQVLGHDSWSIGRRNGKYAVKVEFLNGEMAEQAYQEAFAKVQQLEAQTKVPGKTGKAGAAFEALLMLGNTMARLDPSGGAKMAFVVCAKAWELLEDQDKQNEDIHKLVENLARMIPPVESVKRLANANLGETVLDMLSLIEDVSLFIVRFYSRSYRTKMASFRISDSGPPDPTQEFIEKFKSLKEEFETRMAAQTLETVQALITLQALETARAADVTQILDIAQAEMLRSRLKPVDQAGYDPTRACMPNTRVAIISDITAWVQEPNQRQQLAWIHGLAGLGKSSIATSVCQQLDGRGVLATSFFCKRDNPELRDPHRLLASIAYRLALRWKPYGEAVAAIVKADPEVCSQHVQPLCDALLVRPLKAIAESNQPDRLFTIVVDALDECGSDDTRKQLITCLHNISLVAPWLRVAVTSRPDPDIQECFAQLCSDCYTPYNVLSYDSLPDINVFIRARLSKMERVDGWPKDAADRLSERSSGLFIWARTACEFVTRGPNPRRRLDKVLAGAHLGNPSAQLDDLYTTAITAGAGNEDEDDLADVLQCLGVVITTATRTPLSVPNLARLLRGRISQDTLDYVVQHLSSVLYVDQKRDDAIRVSHPSFTDYITDPSRSKELCVDLGKQNTMLAGCCLETMTKELRFNMCNLESSHLLNRGVPGLDARVRGAIGLHLSYSSMYWTSHLIVARKEPMDVPLRAFLFEPQLLYWIEALSLLGKLSVASSSLLELSLASNITEDCQSYAHDVYRFVLSFYDAISESTPHLYVSALPLAPEKSKMAQHMRKHFPNTFDIIEGAEQEWTPCLRTIWAESTINAAVFSSDGRRIATGSDNGTVRVWDSETGAALLEPMRGHSDWVTSVAFSPNSRCIVSGSWDKTVRVWDAETGVALLEPLWGHSGWVMSVVFSPEAHRIASGSVDKTVRIWDAETGVELLNLQSHSGAVCSVAFSPNGHRIVSGSNDETVRVWDADTGAALLEPLRGHSGEIRSVAFSPNGDRIVSGSDDKTIRIWDAETGAALLQPLQGHSGWVCFVAFSPDSRLLFSGSFDKTARIWNSETGTELAKLLLGRTNSVASLPDGRRIALGISGETLRISGWDAEMRNVQSRLPQGHSGSVRSVAFSPDGHRIISGSDDKTVRVWDSETGDAVLEPLQGHSGKVLSVAFSPDGYRIVSGSEDETLRIWDAETGVGLLELHGHLDEVNSVVFSPDGHRVISGSTDKTIRVWDAETGVVLLEPLQGHLDSVSSVASSPDGHSVASGSNDKTVRIWDAGTGAAFLEPLRGHPDPVSSVAFSADSRRIASSSSSNYTLGFGRSVVRVWDAETGAVLLECLENHARHMLSVAFSPDGRHVVSGAQSPAMQVWDAATAIPLLEPLRGPLHKYIRSAAFSPNSRRIVSGSDDCAIRVWDTNTCARSISETMRFLPDTQIPVTSGCTDSQLVSTSSLLAHYCKSNGWVTTTDGGLLLWLPLDLRTIDNSSICISAEISRCRMVMDFTKFAYGSSWSLVADMSQ